jgi:triosephosphate isomerase
VVVSPTFVHLDAVKRAIGPSYQVAAQNCWSTKGGAFTGEVSAEQLADMGVPWVILGHSERRAILGESDEVVGTKVAYALSQGLKVIACIGETLQQREGGEMFSILDGQLDAIAAAVGGSWDRVVVAYEPVWAIGTGVVATPAQAQEVHAYVREWAAGHVGAGVAGGLRILYGGSVNDGNCEELAGQEDVDGFLVGGAALKASSFVKICNASKAVARA